MLRRGVVVGLVLLALVGCSSGAAEGERIPGVRPGITLDDPDGRPPAPTAAIPVLGEEGELSLADFSGRVVVLNFWASWCGPCRAEQPDLNDAFEALRDEDVAFLGVNIGQDSEPNALAHQREFDVPYPSVYDPASRYAAEFGGIGPRSIPSTILIDAEGRVAARLFGTTTTEEVVTLAERLATEA